MTTLHVDLGKQWRGGQNQALLLIQGLKARGHEAELAAAAGSPLAEHARAAGVRVHEVGAFAAQFQAALPLRRILRRGRHDVVHCHDAHGLLAAWLAGAHRRAAIVGSRRVAYSLLRSRFSLRHYQSASCIVAVSRFVRESVLAHGLPASQVVVVYDGVEVPPLSSQPERLEAKRRWIGVDSPLLGCVGYLLPEKGQELLIRALPLVRQHCGDCRLLLAGDGPCRPGLERLASRLGVGQAVRFTGLVDDISAVYQALDVFLFSSLEEPLGSSLLAAMAHGLPVVALARGAVTEIVEDGRNGLLLQAPDGPGALAAQVVRLLAEPSLRTRLGEAARGTIEERFTADHMIDNTLEVYRRVCRQEERRG